MDRVEEIHRANLEKTLRSSSDLYEYITLEDLVLDIEWVKSGQELSKKLEGKNTLYLRRRFPISSLNSEKVRKSRKWKRHMVGMSLDSKKVLNSISITCSPDQ